MRRLHAELGRNARHLGALEARRESLESERSSLFAAAGVPLGLDLLRLTDTEREWQAWLRQRRDAEQDRGRIEASLARMRAEIRALEIYADRLAADSR